MIHLNFGITNPWSQRWQSLRTWSGSVWRPHLFWELETGLGNRVISFTFWARARTDHAGIEINLELLGYYLGFRIYDQRHTDE